MHASRRTQPYRKGQPRQAGLADKAMRKGRTGTGFNPMDVARGVQKMQMNENGSRQMHKPVAPQKGVMRADPAKAAQYTREAAALTKASANRAKTGVEVQRGARTMSAKAQSMRSKEATLRTQEAAMGKGARSARPKTGSDANFARVKGPVKINTTGNARTNQAYKTVSASGGDWHVYEDGRRVFVKKPGRQAKARRFADAVKAPAKGVSR